MCGRFTGDSLANALGQDGGAPFARASLSGWRPEGPPASSGCDSSDCAYCQALARMRQPGAASGCWLRRKRSRTDLAGMAATAGVTDGATPCSSCGGGDAEREPRLLSLSRVPSVGTLAVVVPDAPAGQPGWSLWDHALLVEEPSASQAWQQPPQQQQKEQPQQALQQQQQQQQQWQRTRRRAADAEEVLERRVRQCSPTSSGGSSGDSPACSTKSGGSSGRGAAAVASWHLSWQSPAVLKGVANFHPPAHHQGDGALGANCCTDLVCALEFEEHGWLLASAGVSKQIRVYSLASRLQHPEDESYGQPLRCHRMPSKLSSLAWNPDAPGAVTVADYDGVVSQVDMESGHLIAEVDEHDGRRVWSVSHSLQRPHLCASAAEDGVVRVWGGSGMRSCLAALRPGGASRAPACGVHLSPFDGDLAAVACADHSAYIYDLRRADQPLLQLAGHARAVSYVQWLAPGRLATASIDASLAVWQLPGPEQDGALQQAPTAAPVPAGGSGGSQGAVLSQPLKRMQGHCNRRNFCGLSVRPEDNLLACGSEADACYVYHQAWASPLAAHSFGSSSPGVTAAGSTTQHALLPTVAAAASDQLCSAVCWQPATARPAGAPPLLAAALSSGELRVLELQRPAAQAALRRCLDG